MAVLLSDKLDLVSILEDGPHLLVFITLCHILSLSSLLLNNRTQQHWGNGASMILLQTIICNFCLTSSLSIASLACTPEETSCHFGEAHMAGGHRHPGAQSGSSSVAVALEGVEDRNSQCLPIPGRALEVASQMVHCYVSSTKHRIWSHGDT